MRRCFFSISDCVFDYWNISKEFIGLWLLGVKKLWIKFFMIVIYLYKTARCSCSMQPIINWTQWKWSRQFWGNKKSVQLQKHRTATNRCLTSWNEKKCRLDPHKATSSSNGKISQLVHSPWACEELCSGHDLFLMHHKHRNQCYLCVVFGLSLSSLTRYKGMSKIKYKVMSGPSWIFIRFQNNSGSPNMSIILGLT